jgi:hypothetical protein
MIWATVLIKKKGLLKTEGRGRFGFLQLPAAGDYIQILNEKREIDFLRVLYVQHDPVSHPNNSQNHELEEPLARIIAELEE